MAGTSANPAYLELRDAAGGVTQVPLRPGMVIGRVSDVDLVLDSPAVSRRHAELFQDAANQWWVRDLGSRNGTSVNGVPVRERQLRHGDLIAIADYALTLNLTPPPFRPTAAAAATEFGQMTIDDTGTMTLNTLSETSLPRIDTRQLFALQRFGRQLLEVPDDAERLGMLCRLMVSEELHGRHAAVIELSAFPGAEPGIIVGPIAPPGAPRSRFYLSRSVMNAVRRAREPVLASNAAARQGAALELSLAPEDEPLAVFACPLRQDPTAMQVLYVVMPGQYGSAEWLGLGALAAEQFGQAEQAWEARRKAEASAALERDLERARQVQMGLLPRDVDVPGLDIAVHFEPCRGVGGDYLDVVRMSDGRVVLAVADVCGKGMQAALVSASVHTAVQAAVHMKVPLAQWMTQLNRFLCERLPAGSFVTMIAVQLDPATGEVETVNAGHPPAVVVDREGGVRLIESSGHYPLGIDPVELTTQRDQLAAGACMALYTDGLTEVADPQGQWLGTQGLAERLAAVCRGQAEVSVRDTARGLADSVAEVRAGRPAEDDQTLLLVRRQ